MITQDRLKELMHYNLDTGELTRLKAIRGCATGPLLHSSKNELRSPHQLHRLISLALQYITAGSFLLR